MSYNLELKTLSLSIYIHKYFQIYLKGLGNTISFKFKIYDNNFLY